jgi:uncharacterized caspase-like protein
VNDLHYAVVVGINRYPGIGDLGGARADAEQFMAWLVDADGGALPKENVKHVCAKDEEEATFVTIEGARPTAVQVDDALLAVTKALRAKLDQDPEQWERTRIYFYVAGHGLAPQGGEGALFLAHADSDALSRNLELAEYRRWCTTCAWFREVVVFADCCRTRYRKAVRGYGPQLDECEAPWQGKSPTYLIGFGSTLGKPTYELPDPGADDQARGYFTRALLEGLRGAAPRDQTGTITAAALSTYVKTVVSEQTRNLQFPQEAQIVGALAAEIRFGTALAPPKRVVSVNLPAEFAGDAKIVKDGRVIATWNSHDRPWRLELEDGIYELQGKGFAHEGLFKVAGEDRSVEV